MYYVFGQLMLYKCYSLNERLQLIILQIFSVIFVSYHLVWQLINFTVVYLIKIAFISYFYHYIIIIINIIIVIVNIKSSNNKWRKGYVELRESSRFKIQ